MSKITVWCGKGKITLHKSKKLVGLKSFNQPEIFRKANYVKKEVYRSLGRFNVVELDHKAGDVNEKLDEVRKKDEVDVGTHVYYAEGSNKPIVPTGEIIIIFEEGVSEEEQKVVLDSFKLDLIERRGPEYIIARVTSESKNPLKVGSELLNLSLVRRAEPDIDVVLDEYDFSEPRDRLLSHQWHLKNNGFVVDANFRLKKGADSKVIDAWRRMGDLGSSKVIVALIDNGFDLSHPDLKGKIVKPFDIWRQSMQITQGDSRFTHGTPCASVAIASANGEGIVGAAPNARFMPVHGTSFDLRDTEQMFDYCMRNGADIISCSWGTTDPNFRLSPEKEQAIARVTRLGRNGKGCVVLFAAGNEGYEYMNYYAEVPGIIAVGACTSKDEHARYSNRSSKVTVCAPSNGDWPILAARAWWDEGIRNEVGNYKFYRDGQSRGKHYKHFGGTSSSTPLVAGVCALMLSVNPDLTANEVKEILQRTADKIGNPNEYVNGHSRRYGFGRVNADKAVAEALRRKEGSKPPATEVQPTISSGQGLFRFSVQKQASQGWGVQIGVFKEYGNVLIQAERLQSLFKQPVIVNISELSGETAYRVIVGVYNDADDARKLQKQMEAKGQKGFVRNLKGLA